MSLNLPPHTPGKMRPASRTTWRAYFHDHPKYAISQASNFSSMDTPNHTAEPTTETTPTDDQSTQLLSTIVHQFIQQGELDDREPENSILDDVLTKSLPVSLEDLFDFSQNFWVTHHQRTGRRSLKEELEIYNLLDADLPGEEGAEVAVDDTTGDILTLHV